MKRLLYTLAALALGLVLLAAPQAAQASGNGPAARTVSPMAGCAVTHYGYTGYAICGFDQAKVTYSNGNVEYFVVGTNYAIFHIWSGSGGWHSLGGVASSEPPNGVYLVGTNPTVIATFGTDDNLWCNDRGTGTWSGWALC